MRFLSCILYFIFLSTISLQLNCGYQHEDNFIDEDDVEELAITSDLSGMNTNNQADDNQKFVQNWSIDNSSDYAIDLGIDVSGGTAKLESSFFDPNWDFRHEITIDNSSSTDSLTDFNCKIIIDNSETDFWAGIENDGESIRFTDSDGLTPIDFWIEKFDYTGDDAIIWIEVPGIPASSSTSVYLYYGNSSSTAASSGLDTFLFFDDFEDNDISDWTNYSSGAVTVAADPSPPAGVTSSFSIEKITNNDPSGGWKYINTDMSGIGLGYIFEGRIYRPDPYSGGAADRLAIEDSSFDGYGFHTNHSNYVLIERRNNGSATTLGSQDTYNPPENVWYKYSFCLKTGGSFDIFYYDMDDSLLTSVTNRTDANYSSFDRVILHGGNQYYVDDMRIRSYTSPEPNISIGIQESYYPSSSPSMAPIEGMSYIMLLSFSHTLGSSSQGVVKYLISNNGTNWYWWNGSNWIAVMDYSNLNTVEDVNSNISQFVDDAGTGTLFFKAFLISDGTQQVELDGIQLEYQ